MKAITTKLLVVAMTATPIFTMAHAGHGHESPLSPGHYLVNPEHFFPLAFTVGAVLFIITSVHFLFIRTKDRSRK